MTRIDDIIADADKAISHLDLKDPVRLAIEEAGRYILGALEEVGGLDQGARRTSKRRASDINFVTDSLTSAATRLRILAETIEAETDTDEMPITGAL